ncbi:uncharacterized protein [Euphorbia lathyris]|uniref:uncharacterized protein n=1 Tax=Euphorbia lathyris TaxID=212925 RepID=UPI0033144C56
MSVSTNLRRTHTESDEKKGYSSSDCRMWPPKIPFSDLRRVETALCMAVQLKKWRRNKRFFSLLEQKQLERQEYLVAAKIEEETAQEEEYLKEAASSKYQEQLEASGDKMFWSVS